MLNFLLNYDVSSYEAFKLSVNFNHIIDVKLLNEFDITHVLKWKARNL